MPALQARACDGANYCTHFSSVEGQHFGEDDTGMRAAGTGHSAPASEQDGCPRFFLILDSQLQ
jgi:hypothetical protein